MGAVPVDWSVNCTNNGDFPCVTLEVNCAFGGDPEGIEYADTIPGSINIMRTSPMIRLVVLDLAKIFMSPLVFRLRFINWQTDPDATLQPSEKKNGPAGCKTEPENKDKNYKKHFKKNRSFRRGPQNLA
jgi:hypothetical protein